MKLPKFSVSLLSSSTVILILLLIGFALFIYNPTDDEIDNSNTINISTRYNTFILNFIKKDFNNHRDTNIAYSSLQIIKPLALLANGADGLTREQINNALDASSFTIDERNNNTNNIILDILRIDPKVTINDSFKIWLGSNLIVKPTFESINSTYYSANISKVNVKEESYDDIQQTWLKNVFPTYPSEVINLTSDNPIIDVLSTSSFKHSLPSYQEIVGDFTMSNGEVIKSTYSRIDHDQLTLYENNELTVITIPLGEDERLELNVFIPRNNMSEFIDLVSLSTLNEWKERTTKTDYVIDFPVLDITTTNKSNNVLKELGINDLFNGKADLSNMVSDTSFVTSFTSITEILIDGYPKERMDDSELTAFTVTSPFFFTIVDTKTSFILNVGVIEEPNRFEGPLSEDQTSE